MKNQHKHDEAWTAVAFLLPIFLLYVSFSLLPLVGTVFLSFTNFDAFSAPVWAGLENYYRLLSDERLGQTLMNTLFFATLDTSLLVFFGFTIAWILENSRVTRIGRTLIFIPVVISMVSAALVWQFLFHRDLGAINFYLGQVGVEKIDWLGSTEVAIFSIIIVDFWKNIGFYVLLYSVGLQGISKDYYEAASIDGANYSWKLKNVTIPLTTPTTFLVISIAAINCFKVFDSMKILTNGGPGDATRSVVMYIYGAGFSALEMGYAAAVSIVLFLALVSFTFTHDRLEKRWVHYE